MKLYRAKFSDVLIAMQVRDQLLQNHRCAHVVTTCRNARTGKVYWTVSGTFNPALAKVMRDLGHQ